MQIKIVKSIPMEGQSNIPHTILGKVFNEIDRQEYKNLVDAEEYSNMKKKGELYINTDEGYMILNQNEYEQV
jgi:hypothetical protein